MIFNPMNLSGKRYLVTGASSGLGRQISITLSQLGAEVVMVARNEAMLMETKEMLEGERHSWYSFDLNKVEEIKDLVSLIKKENGELDGFVHSAGILTTKPLATTTYGFMQEMMRVNVFSFIELTRLITRRGYCTSNMSIVAVSSAASKRGAKAKTAYSATKGALDSAVLTLAVELGETKKIRVNAVNPAWIKTERYREFIEMLGEEKERKIEEKQFLGIAKPEEIANVVAFLLSPAASQITGQSIVIDGGSTLKME